MAKGLRPKFGNWYKIEQMPSEMKKKGLKIIGCNGVDIFTVEYEPPFNYPEHIHHEESWIQVSDSGRATTQYVKYWMPLPPLP